MTFYNFENRRPPAAHGALSFCANGSRGIFGAFHKVKRWLGKKTFTPKCAASCRRSAMPDCTSPSASSPARKVPWSGSRTAAR
ncbi:hypothetical protein SBBP2_1840002 [Burkholderiales bacterium]|nr:hypothetical protein SBBP2_1840002 [Burkholderiales bacterium]